MGRAVVVVPHPDDESIGIAGTIREKVASNEEIWVVLMTHGEASGIFNLLNGNSYCALHQRVHQPLQEGYLASDLTPEGKLSRQSFGQARVREWNGALDQLGHPAGRRRIFDFGDGNLTTAEAANLWQSLFEEFGPETDYYTVQNEMDTVHKDHQNLSNALRDNQSIPVSRKTFYAVYEYNHSVHPTGAGAHNPVSIQPHLGAKAAALGQYRVWNPASGRYQVGEHSTSVLIRTASEWPYEYPYRLPTTDVTDWELY